MTWAWTNRVTFELIGTIKNEPVLWNKKHKEYKNKEKRDATWKKVKNCIINGNKFPTEELENKLKLLMTKYKNIRTEIIRTALKMGRDPDNFLPKWIFYKAMSSFLDDVYQPGILSDSEDIENTDKETEMFTIKNDETLKNIETVEPNKIARKRPISSAPEPKNVNKRSRKATGNKIEEHQYSVQRRVEQDNCSMYSKILCHKLRNLQENTRDRAMLEIDRYLYLLKQNEIHIELLQKKQMQSVPMHLMQPFNYSGQETPVLSSNSSAIDDSSDPISFSHNSQDSKSASPKHPHFISVSTIPLQNCDEGTKPEQMYSILPVAPFSLIETTSPEPSQIASLSKSLQCSQIVQDSITPNDFEVLCSELNIKTSPRSDHSPSPEPAFSHVSIL